MRGECQDFVARNKDMMVSPTKSTVHFATSEPISQSASPNHLKTGKSENGLRPCGKLWPQSSKISTGTFIVPALKRMITSPQVEKAVFKLAPLGNEQMFDLTALDLCVLGIPDDVLRQVILQASHPAQYRTANVASSSFRRLAGRGSSFRGFTNCDLSGSMLDLTNDIDMTCDKNCRPCPLSGQWLHMEELITPVSHRRGKFTMTDTSLLLTHIYVGGAMLFNHPKYNEVVWTGAHVSIFLKAVFGVSPGIQGGLLDLRFLHKLQSHGNDEFLHALQVLALRFQLFGTFIPNNANAGG